MNDLPATTTRTVPAKSMLMDPERFQHVQRVANVYAMSPLFPEHLRKGNKETAIANAILVINIADRLNEEALTVAQNIYFVSGKPGWSSSYMIAKANQHGVFKGTIRWDVKGKGDTLGVTAYATLKDTNERVEVTCDMAMARAEGWTKNAKYQSMPEQMLRYRSATFLIRLYCPEVMVGVPAQIEVELGGEMRDVTPREFQHAEPAKDEAKDHLETEDAQLVEEEPTAKETETVKDKPKDAAPEKGPKAEADQTAKQDAAASENTTAAKAPDPERFRALLEMIKTDLAEAPSVDAVIELYGPQIEQMQSAAPEIHTELQQELDAYREKEAAAQ